VAVVARNGLLEKDVVSTACSSTTAPNPSGICAWEGNAISPAPAVDLSNDPDWQHYRYRVFEIIVPLRNVIWSFNTLG
jgi:type IV pilus assembly protein PilW